MKFTPKIKNFIFHCKDKKFLYNLHHLQAVKIQGNNIQLAFSFGTSEFSLNSPQEAEEYLQKIQSIMNE